MRKLLPTLALVALVAATTACGDDGYSAPERDITVGELLEGDGSPGRPLFDEQLYVQAWEDVAGVLGRDPEDPASLLEDDIADRYAPTLIVACAWAAALEGGGEAITSVGPLDAVPGFAALEDELVGRTGGGDCGALDDNELARLQRDLYVPPTDLATWMLVADIDQLRTSIGAVLAPEIAEAVAG